MVSYWKTCWESVSPVPNNLNKMLDFFPDQTGLTLEHHSANETLLKYKSLSHSDIDWVCTSPESLNYCSL